jgi:hypothetical protein
VFSIFKERKEKQRKAEHEERLKKALAEKCADMGNQYASHEEDETQYTVVTINGNAINVKKEEITINNLTYYKLKTR